MHLTQKILLLIVLLSLIACSSYKAKRQESKLVLPHLGTVVKAKGGLLYDAAAQNGTPHWSTLKVTVQQLPFNIESYTIYAKHMHRAAKINSIPYNDSLRYKPKYIRLQLQDKIELTNMLNNDAHEEMRQYLSLDNTHKFVTAVDIALTEVEINEFEQTYAAKLEKDKFDNIILVLNQGEKERIYLLKDLPIFNYVLNSFCWGEDQYHNRRIENMVDEDEKCPKNTYLKASKIKSDKSYLKF